jgi:hypothetical protein
MLCTPVTGWTASVGPPRVLLTRIEDCGTRRQLRLQLILLEDTVSPLSGYGTRDEPEWLLRQQPLWIGSARSGLVGGAECARERSLEGQIRERACRVALPT